MLEKIKKNDTSFVTGVVTGDLIATNTPVSDPPVRAFCVGNVGKI